MKNAPVRAPHVLLIDDNRDGLLVRRTLLEEAGYRVSPAASGEQGLKLYASSAFDLVVTDFRMPGGIDGVEVIRQIRTSDPNARVVLISKVVEPLGLNEENTGADAVIAKSATEASNLLRAVKRLLNRPARKPAGSQRVARAGAAAVR